MRPKSLLISISILLQAPSKRDQSDPNFIYNQEYKRPQNTVDKSVVSISLNTPMLDGVYIFSNWPDAKTITLAYIGSLSETEIDERYIDI